MSTQTVCAINLILISLENNSWRSQTVSMVRICLFFVYPQLFQFWAIAGSKRRTTEEKDILYIFSLNSETNDGTNWSIIIRCILFESDWEILQYAVFGWKIEIRHVIWQNYRFEKNDFWFKDDDHNDDDNKYENVSSCSWIAEVRQVRVMVCYYSRRRRKSTAARILRSLCMRVGEYVGMLAR